jgi:hypothetical protein
MSVQRSGCSVGSWLAACLAALSAASLPMMPLCPGTHTNMMSDPVCVAVCALFCISSVSGSCVNYIKQDFESVSVISVNCNLVNHYGKESDYE